MRHSRPYINWYNLVITLARNGGGFQLYPSKMHKFLKDTVFVWMTEAKGYKYKGDQVNFYQCSFEIFCGNKPKHETVPPPILQELLQEFSYIF